jgi:hypothetical protein
VTSAVNIISEAESPAGDDGANWVFLRNRLHTSLVRPRVKGVLLVGWILEAGVAEGELERAHEWGSVPEV